VLNPARTVTRYSLLRANHVATSSLRTL
jgi:hypothetical protein